MRNKLIELLFEVIAVKPAETINDMADFLIANGVTLQQWIPVSERLPENGEVVQIWCGEHQIARFNRGISAAERESMKRGEMENPEEFGWSLSTGYIRNKRSDVIKSCDEWGNNTVPYNWESTCGPMKWLGQNVTHWKPKDEPPQEVSKEYICACTLVDAAPTADVEEVVHCEECQHCDIGETEDEAWCECSLYNLGGVADFYCKAGERKTDE